MKKKMIIPAVLGAVLLAACEPVEPGQKNEEGGLAIEILSNAQTKASTDAQTCESNLNKMRVLVYNSSGELYKDEQLASPFNSVTIPNVKAGTYSVYAVANTCAGLTDVKTVSNLKASAVKLDDCSTTASTGFVMFGGKESVAVTASTTATPVSFDVTRFPGRVKLVSVKNELPSTLGALTVENVMLINGYSSWKLDGSGSPGTSMNPAGRKGGTGDVVTSTTADYAAYSFKEVPSSDRTLANGSAAKAYGYYFYSFPNTVSTDKTGSKVTGGKARLVVKATVNERSYYYPVTLDKLERNKCYEVVLKVSGYGSDDPNEPVQKGSIGVTVTVKNWESGADYTETI